MSKLYFYTLTTLDEAFIFTMGASVKESANPIGEFGTGLKYAIAVTLRLGGKIEIETDKMQYRFMVVQETIRNQEMGFIYCHRIDKQKGALPEIRCPMTANYGKTWEAWMVMRELYSNTKDENGIVWDKEELVETDLHGNYTLITVEHDEVYDAWQNRNSYILNTTNRRHAFSHGAIEVYRGRSSALFFRGIRVSSAPVTTQLTYNMVIKTARLTEDRTMDHSQFAGSVLYTMAHCTDRDLIAQFLDAACVLDSFESKLSFAAYDLGIEGTREFAEEACEAVKRNIIFAPSGLKEIVYKYERNKNPEQFYKPVKLTDAETDRFSECLIKLGAIGIVFSDYKVYFTDDMPADHYGSAYPKNGLIVLNRNWTVNHDNWLRQTCTTLIEEYTHLRSGAADCTRDMQEAYNDFLYQIAINGRIS